MSNIKDMKYEKTCLVEGCSSINHRARTRLRLGFGDYCVAEYIEQKEGKTSSFSKENVWRDLGISIEAFKASINLLKEKELIESKGKKYIVTKKWLSAGNENIKEEFNMFWKFKIDDGIKYLWPGAKPMALREFQKTRRKRSFQYIMDQKTWYYQLIMLERKNKFQRNFMKADKFLNVDTGQIDEDYKSQVENHPLYTKPRSPSEKKVLTKEQYDLIYENPNQ
jgi:hypothetical protein